MSITYLATRTAGDTGVQTTVVATGDSSNDAKAGNFACRSLSVTVDFGTIETQRAATSVLACPWVKSAPRPVAMVIGRPTALLLDDEDALVANVRAIVTNIVDGVSFDVVAYTEGGTNGIYTVQIVGV